MQKGIQALLDLKVAELIKDLNAYQVACLQEYGQYQSFVRTDSILSHTDLPFDLEVHEHCYSHGGATYTIFFYYREGVDEYIKRVSPTETVDWQLLEF